MSVRNLHNAWSPGRRVVADLRQEPGAGRRRYTCGHDWNLVTETARARVRTTGADEFREVPADADGRNGPDVHSWRADATEFIRTVYEMIFDWFREHRRKELLKQPFPADWIIILHENVAHYAYLTDDERARLHNDMRIFADEKNWEGCGGLQITDEIKVTIAAQACLLLLNLEHDYFANVESVLVYPTDYVAKESAMGSDGLLHVGPSHRLGEAWRRGPVVLSWIDVKAGGMNERDGHNVVLHEFAHKLDLGDGRVDGVPRLADDAQYERWAEVMSAEYERLVDNAEKGHATLLDDYGATDAGEFFAVATECFFEKSRQLRERHPELYTVLQSYYKQDTAARVEAHTEAELEPGQQPDD